MTDVNDITAITVNEGWIIFSRRSTGLIYEVDIDGNMQREIREGVVSVLNVYDKRTGKKFDLKLDPYSKTRH